MSADWKKLSQIYAGVVDHARARGVSEDVLSRHHYRRFHEAALNRRLPGVAFVNGRWMGQVGLEAEMAAAFGLTSANESIAA